MNNQRNKESFATRERRMLPFFVEFVKFFAGFTIIVVVAILALHAVVAMS